MPQRVVNGTAIREARFLAGLSQRALARKVGITEQAMSQVELGTNGMRPENLKKVAKILGVPLIDLTKVADEEVAS